MKLTNTQFIPAPKAQVWDALNDAEVLKQCIPGCTELVRVSPDEMAAKATVKVGPITANFGGTVTFADVNPPDSYVLHGEGQGGVAGVAKGSAKVALEDTDGGTMLHYDVNAEVGGKIAQLGSRLIDATARKMAGQFFAKFGAVVAAPVAPVIAATVETAAAVTGSQTPEGLKWLGLWNLLRWFGLVKA